MSNAKRIKAYNDAEHAEDYTNIQYDENGYKFRIIDGLVVPPYVTPARYKLARSFVTRDGDICYCSFPKSGSTWLAYIILLIIQDSDLPENSTLRSNLHWIESSWTYPRNSDSLDNLTTTRVFKSHMPYRMSFGGDPNNNSCKYVYIARNPKDVATSYYYFECNKAWSGHFSVSWETWLKMFIDGKVQRGDWFSHVLGWWQHSDNDNVLFMRYEDLINDFHSQIFMLGKFLNITLDNDSITNIMNRTSFENMKNNEFSNMHEIEDFEGFFRKGKIGSWKNQFTREQTFQFDKLIKERLGGTGLDFCYE